MRDASSRIASAISRCPSRPAARRRLLARPNGREEVALRDRVVEQALQIIRNRIDQFGVAEPTIQVQGTTRSSCSCPASRIRSARRT